jgi:hypothetical protein
MHSPSLASVARHTGRILIAMAVSIATLFAYAWLLNASSLFRPLTLFAIPFSVLAGVLPLIYWYRRDAYPIGIAFCLGMFFLLSRIGQALERTL